MKTNHNSTLRFQIIQGYNSTINLHNSTINYNENCYNGKQNDVKHNSGEAKISKQCSQEDKSILNPTKIDIISSQVNEIVDLQTINDTNVNSQMSSQNQPRQLLDLNVEPPVIHHPNEFNSALLN